MVPALSNTSINLGQQHPSFQSLNESDKIIYEKNNARLRQLEMELRELSTFGGACDELMDWLKDSRAYNVFNEAALLSCVATIADKATEYGPWSGKEVLKQAKDNCQGLSDKGQNLIKKYYSDLHNVVFKRRPSDSANSPATQQNLTLPQSPSNKTIFNSPTNFNALVQSLLESNVTPPPLSPIVSPRQSPHMNPMMINGQNKHSMLNPLIFVQKEKEKQMRVIQQAQQQQAQQVQAHQAEMQRLAQAQQQQQQQQSYFRMQQQQQQQQQQQLQQYFQAQQKELQKQQNLQKQLQQQQLQRQQQIQFQHQNAAFIQRFQQLPSTSQPTFGHSTVVNNAFPQTPQVVNFVRPTHSSPPQFGQQSNPQFAQQQSQPITYWIPVDGNARNSNTVYNPITSPASSTPPTPTSSAFNMNSTTSTTNTTTTTTTTNTTANVNATTSMLPSSPSTSSVISPVISTAFANPNGRAPSVGHYVSNAAVATAAPMNQVFLLPSETTMTSPIVTATAAATMTESPRASIAVAPYGRVPVTSSMGAMVTPSITIPATVTTIPATITTAPMSAHTNNQPSTAVPTATTATTTAAPVTTSSTAAVVRPTSEIEANASSAGDYVRFTFVTGYAVLPFKLMHDEEYQRQRFHVAPDTYRLLLRTPETKIKRTETNLPLSFVLTSSFTNTSERKCDWPASLRVELNGREIHLEKRQKHTGNQGQIAYIGKDMPYDLTKLLKVGDNTLGLHQFACACSYRFSVQIHMKFSENWILDRVEDSMISIEESEKMIDSLLGKSQSNDDDDDDLMVVQESVKLRLKCPITMVRMKQPVRGKKCKHIDCFDLKAYLLVNNTRNPTWQCPHCNNMVGPNLLVRDELTEKLLKELPKNVAEIEYTQDHSQYKIIQLDDPDSDEEEDSDIKKSTEVIVAVNTTNMDVIDLISDDDEEEEEEEESDENSNAKRPRLS
ncbi:MAG: hypothetical protein EXX96DRAFT_584533 [Benjaminiella poitrasii]|nr:MAG: hypothetical protein EXX96DRAFT_584533 [Benjaminiella poitrasii]